MSEGTIDFDASDSMYRHMAGADLGAALLVTEIFRFRRISRALMAVGAAFARTPLIPITRPILHPVYRQFLGGESIDEAIERAAALKRSGILSILDYAVEAQTGEAACDKFADEVVDSIETAATRSGIHHTAVKPTALGLAARRSTFHSPAADSVSSVRVRLNRVLEAAISQDAIVFIDAEHSWYQDDIDTIAEDAMARYNIVQASVYTTLQMYRRDRLSYLRNLIDAAKDRYVLGIKLVRGAYLEEENALARRVGADSPLFPSKANVDAAYNEAIAICLDAPNVEVCIATHNELSCQVAVARIRRAGSAGVRERVMFAQLLGMADHISSGLADAGLRTAKYIPYAPLRHALPYLVRRAQENTASFDQMANERVRLRRELHRRWSLRK